MDRELLEALRTQTQTLHRQLDSHEVLKPLVSPELCSTSYANALKALYFPQKTLETILLTHLSNFFPHYIYTARYPLIEKDLIQFNNHPADIFLSTKDISNKSKILGTLYVLEGSKLGAKQILRQLEKKRLPTRFFESALADNQSGWKGFAELTHSEAINATETVAAAVDAFNLFIEALSQNLTNSETRNETCLINSKLQLA
ncbi:MAG: biliverdin-producing heme oxygenase [Nitrincola sp.]|nr:biliverdin-producing heme oxygenase [Nitrincola sp.]